jgi:transcriptional regulator with XRE-family HTH domain
MTLAERLQRMLARHQITQADVAKAAGMNRQQVHRIVMGTVANPNVVTLQRIVEAMGGTLGELFADDGK